MSFNEISYRINSTFALGMNERETVEAMNQLDLKARLERTSQGPFITAAVPSGNSVNPFDWSRALYGRLEVYYDHELRLGSVYYTVPRLKQKRDGGFWPNEPILLMGDPK